MASPEFKAVARQAQPFMSALHDFSLGTELSLENMVTSPLHCLFRTCLLITVMRVTHASVQRKSRVP